MGVEIERKFLINIEKFPLHKLEDPCWIRQGYLSRDPVVRVRHVARPNQGFITVKGKGTLSRQEFEYEIPPDDATALLALCPRTIVKQRSRLGRWELDHFTTPNIGWLAEIELESPDETFEKPEWLGKEVTDDPSYANVNIAYRDEGLPAMAVIP